MGKMSWRNANCEESLIWTNLVSAAVVSSLPLGVSPGERTRNTGILEDSMIFSVISLVTFKNVYNIEIQK
jgi:hypothetical protein